MPVGPVGSVSIQGFQRQDMAHNADGRADFPLHGCIIMPVNPSLSISVFLLSSESAKQNKSDRRIHLRSIQNTLHDSPVNQAVIER